MASWSKQREDCLLIQFGIKSNQSSLNKTFPHPACLSACLPLGRQRRRIVGIDFEWICQRAHGLPVHNPSRTLLFDGLHRPSDVWVSVAVRVQEIVQDNTLEADDVRDHHSSDSIELLQLGEILCGIVWGIFQTSEFSALLALPLF